MVGGTVRASYAEAAGRVTGRWTKQEHEKFIEGLKIHGKNWKKVEEFIGTRSGAQIRSHAQKFFNRIQKEFGVDCETYIKQKQSGLNCDQSAEALDEPSEDHVRARSLSHNVTLPSSARTMSTDI